MKVWKRCLCALLAFIMLFTSANVGFAAGRLDKETNVWSATAADIVAEHYGLASNPKIAAVLSNGAINSGAEYVVAAPYVNGTEGKQDLIAVDFRNKAFYVKSYETEGYLWIPTAAVLLADGEEKETFNLTESVCYYNNVEYYATEAFTYDGKHYTIEVTYELAVSIDAAEQQRIMEIPAYLVQTAKNIEKTLSGMWYDLYTFNGMVPALYSLLSLSLPADETAGKEAEPFFDKTAHAAEIAAIEALYAECMKAETPPQLEMFLVCDESLKTPDSGLVYAMEEGEKVKNTAAALYEKLEVLAKSQRLNSLTSRFKAYDAAQGTSLSIELKNLYRYLDRFVGTAGKDGSLELLKDEANWAILDPAVQESIFKEKYSSQEFAALEAVVSSLRNVTYVAPEVGETTITAMQVTVPCEIVTYDVVVNVSASAYNPETDSVEPLNIHTETVTLLKGTEAEDVIEAVDALGLEEKALNDWAKNYPDYQIGLGQYERWVDELEDPLQADLNYEISYTPKVYTIKTNFSGKNDYPFGYHLLLPEYVGEDGWYDYHVKYDDKRPSDIVNQGTIFIVDGGATIRQETGLAKSKCRILTFLADDPQYKLSDEAKKILKSEALRSSVIKIRIPDTKIDGEIPYENGKFQIEAKNVPSGITGMTWILTDVLLYKGAEVVENVKVSGGKAIWETMDFTRVEASYYLEITKLSHLKELSSAELTEGINLPHVLSKEISQQHAALSGNSGVTAKTMFEQLSSGQMALVMTMLGNVEEWMETEAGRNAVRILNTPEDKIARDDEENAIGYGARSASGDKLALLAYLEDCKDAGWSVATYYQQGYDIKLAKHSSLLAKCIGDIAGDPGLAKYLGELDPNGTLGLLERLNDVDEVVSGLYELSGKMKGPNENLILDDEQFSTLISDCLEAAGKTSAYHEISSLCAYRTVSHSSASSGMLKVTVAINGDEKLMDSPIDYELDNALDHKMTKEEENELWNFIAEVKASANLDARTEQFYDLTVKFGTKAAKTLDILPREGDALKGGNTLISIEYTPKTYTVTIKGLSTDKYRAEFTYHGGEEPYTITLPAKSGDPEEKSYYRYTFPGKTGDDAVRNVANGTTGYFSFSEEDLLTLFTGGNYSIIRKELKIKSGPELTFKPTLSAELIRGAKAEAARVRIEEKIEKRYYLFLDANPAGLNYGDFLENVKTEVEDGNVSSLRVYNPDGTELSNEELVGTGDVVRYKLKDVFGKDYEFKDNEPSEYTIIMMGDVNGDGKCNEEDFEKIFDAYFLEENKKLSYQEQLIEELGMTQIEIWAANMNNSKKLDSNDAWIIRSKSLYWDGDKKESQIVYRTVLK